MRALDAGLAVLLCGETGTGKEVLSRHIHVRSAWRAGPFVAINCAALPEHLVESELFGYEPGAFTGARREGARGLLRQAQGGVLFLDEIGDMPLALQTRLLRVLQEREVQPLGSDKRVPLAFGLVSASHQDLKALVAQGRFRADLYYRLQDMPLHLPPLRKRPDLAVFIDDAYRALGGYLSGDALAALARHDWPGNYRELFSVLRRLRCQHPGTAARRGQQSARGHTVPAARNAAAARPAGHPWRPRTPWRRPGGTRQTALSRARADAGTGLRALERQAIEQALQACQGNVSHAARRLGIHRSTLYRKLNSAPGGGDSNEPSTLKVVEGTTPSLDQQQTGRPKAACLLDQTIGRLLTFEEGLQLVRAAGVAQLAQGLGLDLADAFAGHVELLADFFQGLVGAHFDAETHAQDLGFARRQRVAGLP